MAKSKEGKPEEYHLSQIRHYKKEIKRLNQRIKQLERELGYRDKSNNLKEEKEELPDCQECGKGFLRQIEVVGRRIKVCNTCNWRSKAVKI